MKVPSVKVHPSLSLHSSTGNIFPTREEQPLQYENDSDVSKRSKHFRIGCKKHALTARLSEVCGELLLETKKKNRQCLRQRPLCRNVRSSWILELSTTIQLILQEEWKDLLIHVSTERGRADVLRYSNSSDHMGQNILHLVCGFDPPLCVVKKIHQIKPCCARHRDHQLRYPLHVAVASGARTEVIDYLVRKYAKAALMQDVAGKTPLHIDCENPSFARKSDNETRGVENKRSIYDIATIICFAAPLAVIVEDHDGATPLEYALLSMGDSRLTTFLQGMTVRVRTEIAERKQENEGKMKLHNQFPMLDPSLLN